MKILAGVLCLVALTQSGEVRPRRQQPNAEEASLLAETVKTTVLIDSETKAGSGTIVYSDGKYILILTCWHVVNGEKHIRFWHPKTGFLPTKVEKLSESLDLALLSAEVTKHLPTIKITTVIPALYERLYVAGAPGAGAGPGAYGHVSEGFLTGKSMHMEDDPGSMATYWRITGAVIYPGISGGLVFDHDGKLVCVPSRGEDFDAGYCISGPNVRGFLSGYSV